MLSSMVALGGFTNLAWFMLIPFGHIYSDYCYKLWIHLLLFKLRAIGIDPRHLCPMYKRIKQEYFYVQLTI